MRQTPKIPTMRTEYAYIFEIVISYKEIIQTHTRKRNEKETVVESKY